MGGMDGQAFANSIFPDSIFDIPRFAMPGSLNFPPPPYILLGLFDERDAAASLAIHGSLSGKVRV